MTDPHPNTDTLSLTLTHTELTENTEYRIT